MITTFYIFLVVVPLLGITGFWMPYDFEVFMVYIPFLVLWACMARKEAIEQKKYEA